jgi:excisionase family DNA binding protein
MEARNQETITVEEAAEALHIGRSLAYRLARASQLPGVFKLGRRFLISRRAFERALEDPTTLSGS